MTSMDAHTSPRARRSLRTALTVIAALIPIIPVLVGLSLSAGGGAARAQTPGKPLHLAVAPQTQTAAGPSPSSLALPAGSGTIAASLMRPVALRRRPGGPVLAQLQTRTQFGSPTVLYVARVAGRWLGVVTPQAGNNRLGWIPAAAASLSRLHWELTVSLSARRVSVVHDGRTVHRYTVAVGKPSAPTPTGRFAVTDRLLTGDPSGPYGCCILALSAVAPHAIQDWTGGNRIAIHSTPETDTIGEPVSHGCLRLTLAEGRWLVSHIPLGTPTLISS